MHNPDCNCRPGSEETGWHEKRDSRCIAAEYDEFASAMQQWQNHWPTSDEYWSLRQNGYSPGRQVIHNVIRSVGDLG